MISMETVLCIIGSNHLVTLSVNTPAKMQECINWKKKRKEKKPSITKDTGLCWAFAWVCADVCWLCWMIYMRSLALPLLLGNEITNQWLRLQIKRNHQRISVSKAQTKANASIINIFIQVLTVVSVVYQCVRRMIKNKCHCLFIRYTCSATCLSKHQPITLQQVSVFNHVDVVNMTCWSSNCAAEWGREAI